jgi:hypothetical protein
VSARGGSERTTLRQRARAHQESRREESRVQWLVSARDGSARHAFGGLYEFWKTRTTASFPRKSAGAPGLASEGTRSRCLESVIVRADHFRWLVKPPEEGQKCSLQLRFAGLEKVSAAAKTFPSHAESRDEPIRFSRGRGPRSARLRAEPLLRFLELVTWEPTACQGSAGQSVAGSHFAKCAAEPQPRSVVSSPSSLVRSQELGTRSSGGGDGSLNHPFCPKTSLPRALSAPSAPFSSGRWAAWEATEHASTEKLTLALAAWITRRELN